MISRLPSGLLVWSMLLVSVFGTAAWAATQPMDVVVGIPPVAYLAEQIGRGHVQVQVLASSGQCAHDFALSPKQLLALGRAKLILSVGMPFESRLSEKLRHTHPDLLQVDVSAGIKRRALEAHEESDTHEHADESSDEDPHVWLGPAQLKTLAVHVAEAFERVDPAHRDDYRASAAALKARISRVESDVSEVLQPLHGQTVYVYHPALGYLADAYGIRQQPVELAGKSPTPKRLLELIKQAHADRVKAIFIEPDSDRRSAEVLAQAIGCRLVVVDPMAKDVLNNLASIADALRKAR
jgi:zinc transport system substrate-binding protein